MTEDKLTLNEEKKILDEVEVGLPETNTNETSIFRKLSAGVNQKNSVVNLISNQKYSILTFLPIVFLNQIKQFFDALIFCQALSQCIPIYSIGPPVSIWAPWFLIFFLVCFKEGTQDYSRYKKDKEVNSQIYTVFRKKDKNIVKLQISSSEIKTGDFIFIKKNSRIPADLVLIKSYQGKEVFIRTDQLDGETDWKLRMPPTNTQEIEFEFFENEIDERFARKAMADRVDESLVEIDNNENTRENIQKKTVFPITGREKIDISFEGPHKDIYTFIGSIQTEKGVNPLNIENTLWRDTILATSQVLGCVIYTGKETKTSLNTSNPRNKTGKMDKEVNEYTIYLFFLSIIISLIFTAMNFIKSRGRYDVVAFKFLLIFNSIIPISLKATIDTARMFFYTREIQKGVKDCVVRNPNITEDLGRISYILSDKTGTLTQNIMLMKKLHLGNLYYSIDLNDEIRKIIRKEFLRSLSKEKKFNKGQSMNEQLLHLVNALSVCHNVTPVIEGGKTMFQASSPDEVAILEWCEDVGVKLIKRKQKEMIIDYSNLINDLSIYKNTNSMSKVSGIDITALTEGDLQKKIEILEIFPFTSDTKRMGIIVKVDEEYFFYLKGADMIMQKVIIKSDWLNEEVDFMAREGLRTLVIAMKRLSKEEYKEFDIKMKKAKLSVNRRTECLEVQKTLEKEMILLGVTGVEDKLQENVMLSLELFKNAGIKTWILTGDKIETAISIAQSTKLFLNRNYRILSANNRSDALREIEFLKSSDIRYIVLDGNSLAIFQKECFTEFINVSSQMEAVVACRCTPTQKAEVTAKLKNVTGKLTCAIGDGGNDVSMITAANMGIGIVGKEGNQASLASDISINKFSDLSSLILWHGRNTYSSTSRIFHYIIHRGTILVVVQGIFIALNKFLPFSLLQGFLGLSFVCIYTACPMFALVEYKKMTKKTCFRYPELYKELKTNKEISSKNILKWFLISFYQGSILMGMSFYYLKNELASFITIIFSSMVINEFIVVYLMVGFYSRRIVYAVGFSFFLFLLTFAFVPQILILPSGFIEKAYFFGKVLLMNAASSIFLVFKVLYEMWGSREQYLKE